MRPRDAHDTGSATRSNAGSGPMRGMPISAFVIPRFIVVGGVT
jgi:hypothetical protein